MAIAPRLEADAREILRFVGYPVRSGTRTGWGLHRRELVEIGSADGYGGTLARAETLAVVTSDFPLSIGDAIEVDFGGGAWRSYRIANRTTPPEGMGSGVLERFVLEEA